MLLGKLQEYMGLCSPSENSQNSWKRGSAYFIRRKAVAGGRYALIWGSRE